MPSRTIYLPDDVDQLVNELDVNLSRLTQDAVRTLAAQESADCASRLAAIRQRVADAELSYPQDHLAKMRQEAGDDLR